MSQGQYIEIKRFILPRNIRLIMDKQLLMLPSVLPGNTQIHTHKLFALRSWFTFNASPLVSILNRNLFERIITFKNITDIKVKIRANKQRKSFRVCNYMQKLIGSFDN